MPRRDGAEHSLASISATAVCHVIVGATDVVERPAARNPMSKLRAVTVVFVVDIETQVLA